MFKRIELNNFQAHKHTVIDFSEGINSICGESDNGKTAIIRGIKWVLENRPSGTDTLNSRWNAGFKEPMSVRIYTDKGWVERIRTKDRNGYTICTDGKETELSAIGKDVPPEVTEFFHFSDVNTQYQFDQPYLISMTGGKASEYLNKLVNIDTIDQCLALADSEKRQITSEQHIVEADIATLENKVESCRWVEQASELVKRISIYDETLSRYSSEIESLENDRKLYLDYSLQVIDFTKHKNLISEIENIVLSDVTELESQIDEMKMLESRNLNLDVHKKLVSEIENIVLFDVTELEKTIADWHFYNEQKTEKNELTEKLKSQLPDICPYCGSVLKEHNCV